MFKSRPLGARFLLLVVLPLVVFGSGTFACLRGGPTAADALSIAWLETEPLLPEFLSLDAAPEPWSKTRSRGAVPRSELFTAI